MTSPSPVPSFRTKAFGEKREGRGLILLLALPPASLHAWSCCACATDKDLLLSAGPFLLPSLPVLALPSRPPTKEKGSCCFVWSLWAFHVRVSYLPCSRVAHAMHRAAQERKSKWVFAHFPSNPQNRFVRDGVKPPGASSFLVPPRRLVLLTHPHPHALPPAPGPRILAGMPSEVLFPSPPGPPSPGQRPQEEGQGPGGWNRDAARGVKASSPPHPPTPSPPPPPPATAATQTRAPASCTTPRSPPGPRPRERRPSAPVLEGERRGRRKDGIPRVLDAPPWDMPTPTHRTHSPTPPLPPHRQAT